MPAQDRFEALVNQDKLGRNIVYGFLLVLFLSLILFLIPVEQHKTKGILISSIGGNYQRLIPGLCKLKIGTGNVIIASCYNVNDLEKSVTVIQAKTLFFGIKRNYVPLPS